MPLADHACRLLAADLHAVEVLAAGSLLSIWLQTTAKLPGTLHDMAEAGQLILAGCMRGRGVTPACLCGCAY